MPTLQIEQQKLFYNIYGAGDPLLLLHGWMQTGHELLPLARALSEHFTVILPDLPGYGKSVPPFRSFPANFYERDARSMATFLKALKVHPAHILGYSDGGEVALLLGVLYPDRCRSVVAWGATGFFTPDLCAYAQTHIAPMQVSAEQRALHPRQNVAAWPGQWANAFCQMIAAGGDLSLSKVGALRSPVLLMLGDQDRLNPVEAGRQFIDSAREQQPELLHRFRVFAQTGHAIDVERPVQFLETVLGFLHELGSRSLLH